MTTTITTTTEYPECTQNHHFGSLCLCLSGKNDPGAFFGQVFQSICRGTKEPKGAVTVGGHRMTWWLHAKSISHLKTHKDKEKDFFFFAPAIAGGNCVESSSSASSYILHHRIHCSATYSPLISIYNLNMNMCIHVKAPSGCTEFTVDNF